ncbi:conjugal transfer protein TraR [Sphingomonas sp. PsM26]|nr:conjugal transfer protein TraR [Sphingomonas sp. PsM26]
MADVIDMAQRLQAADNDAAIAAACVPVPRGVSGECNECGDESKRLVAGWCAPCRDARDKVVRTRGTGFYDFGGDE